MITPIWFRQRVLTQRTTRLFPAKCQTTALSVKPEKTWKGKVYCMSSTTMAFLIRLLGLKHPTGYCGCGRCMDNRICFLDLNAPLRTDENFEDRLQPQHHHFTSLLERELGLKCITQSPLDAMHLIYGCSVRRLLFWYINDTVNFKMRLSSSKTKRFRPTSEWYSECSTHHKKVFSAYKISYTLQQSFATGYWTHPLSFRLGNI